MEEKVRKVIDGCIEDLEHLKRTITNRATWNEVNKAKIKRTRMNIADKLKEVE